MLVVQPKSPTDWSVQSEIQQPSMFTYGEGWRDNAIANSANVSQSMALLESLRYDS